MPSVPAGAGLQQRDIDMFFRRLEKSYTEQMRQKTTMTQVLATVVFLAVACFPQHAFVCFLLD